MSFQKLKHWINENVEARDITVLYPGGFKPMTGGHLDLIERYNDHPSVKEVKVLVGPGVRNGIDQDLAYDIATKLTSHLNNVTIEKSKYPSPILTAYKTIEEAKPGNYALGASSKGDDYKRVRDFTDQHLPDGKYAAKVPEGVFVVELAIESDPAVFQNRKGPENHDPISASILRKDVMNGDRYQFATGYPNSNTKQIDAVWNALKGKVLESFNASNEFIFEGGNAIKDSRRLNRSELTQTYDDVVGVLGEVLNLPPESLKPLGSFNKKIDSDTYGDIDIAVDINQIDSGDENPLNYIALELENAGFEVVKMPGLKQVTIGFPINGDGENGTAQVDLMLSNNLVWSDFAYNSPDFTKDESKYKGLYANNLMMAIISEAYKNADEIDDDGNVIQYTFYAFRPNSGIFQVTKTHRGKKGLVKNAKILTQDKLTDDPLDALHLAIGDGYDDTKIAHNFEKLWDIINLPDFIHKDKLDMIKSKFVHYMNMAGVEMPSEVNESLNESVLNEMSASKLNTHMRHAEELLFDGKEGLEFIQYIFDELFNKMVNNESNSTLSVKIDGAPAMMLWSNFNGLEPYGVGTKSVFSKNPITCHSKKDVDEKYGDRPDLADKLKVLLKYAKSINIPDGEIWQGDFLFDKNNLVKEDNNITFKPNTIKYSVDLDTDLGKEIKSSEFGIAWHTRYLGNDTSDLRTVFSIDLNDINTPEGIYQSEPYIKQISAENLEQLSEGSEELRKELDELYGDLEKLDSEEYSDFLGYKTFVSMFYAYHNSLIKSGNQLDPNNFIEDFLGFVSTKKSNKIVEKFGTWIETHYDTVMLLVKLTNDISNIKRYILGKLNKLETYKAYVDLKSGGSKSINQEGFAISSPEGNVVKIVDREEFFYLNSSPDVIKGWDK